MLNYVLLHQHNNWTNCVKINFTCGKYFNFTKSFNNRLHRLKKLSTIFLACQNHTHNFDLYSPQPKIYCCLHIGNVFLIFLECIIVKPYPYGIVACVTEPAAAVVAGNSGDAGSSGAREVRMTGSAGHNLLAAEARTERTHPEGDSVCYTHQHTADMVFDGHYLQQRKQHQSFRNITISVRFLISHPLTYII